MVERILILSLSGAVAGREALVSGEALVGREAADDAVSERADRTVDW
jgi:hypothetical protein